MARALANVEAKIANGDFYDAHTMLKGVVSRTCALKKDYAEAARWYQRAADAGDAHGLANLGFKVPQT